MADMLAFASTFAEKELCFMVLEVRISPPSLVTLEIG